MKFLVTKSRSLNSVPKLVLSILMFLLFSQCFWYASTANHKIYHAELPLPPDYALVKLSSLDEMITASKLLMLWLQAFDQQPGYSVPLRDLNYERVINWLDLVLQLDNKTGYPLLAAIRFYAEVKDEDKQREMIAFVKRRFLENPNKRWMYMAHAVYIAKHKLEDLSLALECARLIRENATAKEVPYWAKQMEIFVLEDMGELESAKILIGGLLDSGELDDPQQQLFLSKRLQELQDKE